MHRRPGRIRVHRRVDKIVLNLRRRTDDNDLAFENGSVVIIGVPERGIEYLVERLGWINTIGTETERMVSFVADYGPGVAQFQQCPRGKRSIDFGAGIRRNAGQE